MIAAMSRAKRDMTVPDAETQLSSLIFGVILLDSDLRIIDVNPAAEDYLGSSVKRLIGQAFVNVVEFEDALVLARLTYPAEGLTVRRLPIRIGRKNRLANLTVSPISDSCGHVTQCVVSISDAGHVQRSGDTEQTGPFRAPAILAHEIKNPLAAIRGATQLIGRKLASDDTALIDIVTHEVDRIARLVDRMHLLGSEMCEPPIPCNSHEIIRSALSVVAASNPADITLLEEFDPSLPQILASRDALQQVIINLLSNALNACGENSDANVIVRTRYVSSGSISAIRDGRSQRLPIEISIVDNGPGIDPALQGDIFEPFVTNRMNGQGLGLALARKLMRDMNGLITHHRNDADGQTVFACYLPVAGEPGSQ